MDIIPGTLVRIYYDSDLFDEGQVVTVNDAEIIVDFYDWTERWDAASKFKMLDLYWENKKVLAPIEKGEVVTVFG